VVACAPQLDPARAYVEAARLAPTDPAGAAALCDDQLEPVRSECLTLTAHAAAATDPDQGGALCERTEPGFWQDECWFLVAEASVPHHGGAAAVERCDRAGRFVGNCLDHVWRAHARALLATRAPADAADAYGPALAWADGRVDQKPGQLRGRFWQKFYDAPLHHPELPALDLGWCAAMAGEPGDRCSALLPAAFRHTLVRLDREQAMQGRPADPAACDPDAALSDRVQAAYAVTYVAHPSLDALAERQLAARCRGGRR
jgi:hypothetical protein